jgi:integral membrane sensor domain MASE1
MPGRATRIGVGAALALAYFVTAYFGFRMAVVAEQVTMVWPPTGIALAALLLYGSRFWPAIWIAAFAANAATAAPIWTAAGIATGNTLEAVTVAWTVSSLAGFNPGLQRTRDVVVFFLAAGVATMISATIGVTMLCAGGVQPWSSYWTLWFDWALGDALGALVVAPAILTVVHSPVRLRGRQLLETGFLILLAVVVTEVIFGEVLASVISAHPLEFVVFPLVITAAVRVGQPATSLVVLTTSALTIWNTTFDHRREPGRDPPGGRREADHTSLDPGPLRADDRR